MDEDQRERDPEIASVYNQLVIENKVKLGIQNMLQAHDTFQKGDDSNKQKMEQELITSNNKLAALTKELEIRQKMQSSKKSRPASLSFGSQPDLSDFKNKDSETVTNYIVENLSKKEIDSNIKILFLKKVIYWFESTNPDLQQHKITLFTCLRNLLWDHSKDLRCLVLKGLFQMMNDSTSVGDFFMLRVDFFLIRFLTSSVQWEPEREQSIRIIRKITSFSQSNLKLFRGLVRVLVAIAEQPDDKFRFTSVELLCELIVWNPQLVVQCGGMRVILNSLFDLPLEMSRTILQILLALLDCPASRKYIKSGYDFEIILSAFLETDTKTEFFDDRLKTAAHLTKDILRSWNGIMYLCVENRRGLRHIVQALTSNSQTRTLLDMFFEIFDLTLPEWDIEESSTPEYESNRNQFGRNSKLSLVDQYHAILLQLLFEAKVFDHLINILKGHQNDINFYTIILLAELLKISNHLELPDTVIPIQSLPLLLELSLNFRDKLCRHEATSALVKIDEANMAFLRTINSELYYPSLGTMTITPHGQKYIAGIKRQVGGQIDENHFRSMLNETQVLIDKDFYKWNWDIITELLQGPLLNSKRLEEAIKGTKFMKRLLQFFSPASKMFSEIKNLKYNHRYVQAGCELMYTLLANPEGVRYLMENEFLSQIRDAFAELDPIHGSGTSEPLFSSEKMKHTLTSSYFILLGALSKYKTGIRVLEKFRIFDSFYHLSEGKSRDDLTKAIITSLDYRTEGHPHCILSKILTSAYKHMRLFATNYLRVLLRSNVKGFNEWGIRLLITQLYDPSLEVCEMAVLVLDEACMNEENLNTLVKLKPKMNHLDFAADTLLLRYLSTSEGLDYLLDLDYVENQMELWFQNRNQHYVTRIELSLARALNTTETDPETSLWFDEKYSKMLDDPEKMPKLDGVIFPHFYGQLTKTAKGCDILISKGHLKYFCNFVVQHKTEHQDPVIITHLKSNLWTLGHIGSSETGLGLLCSFDVIESIVWIVDNSQVFSLRGTAFFVLGLITNTRVGCSLISDIKSELNSDLSNLQLNSQSSNHQTNYNLINVSQWKYEGYSMPSDSIFLTFTQSDPVEREIVETIGNLSNQVLITPAIKSLIRLKSSHPSKFKLAKLFITIVEMMSNYHFKLTVRQFLWDLFDIDFCPNLFSIWDASSPTIPNISHKPHNSLQLPNGTNRTIMNRHRTGTL